MQGQHHQPCTITCLGPLQHLLIPERVAKRRVGALADKEVDPDGLSGIVVDEEHFRLAQRSLDGWATTHRVSEGG